MPSDSNRLVAGCATAIPRLVEKRETMSRNKKAAVFAGADVRNLCSSGSRGS
jgi:hypothetical protein